MPTEAVMIILNDRKDGRASTQGSNFLQGHRVWQKDLIGQECRLIDEKEVGGIIVTVLSR